MDFGHLFDDRFLSDFQLAFVNPEGIELSRFNVHGVVLAGQSPYFKARLQNWTEHNQELLSLTVNDDELEAAELMLRCAYTAGAAVDAVSSNRLLGCMVLADRWVLNHPVSHRWVLMWSCCHQSPLGRFALPRGSPTDVSDS